MSSMVARLLNFASICALSAAAATPACAQVYSSATTPAQAQSGADWDRARAAHSALPPGAAAQAVYRWQMLSASDRFGFDDYASFMLSNPGFPEETKLRGYAERALEREAGYPQRVAAFFSRFAPQSNPARAQYALALFALNRPEAAEVGRQAWRGGTMSDAAESALLARLSGSLSPVDHDARMDALLWAGATAQAQRQLAWTSPAARPALNARLIMLTNGDPATMGFDANAAQRDAGYLYNRSRMLRGTGQVGSAVALMAYRPALASPPLDARRWISELLTVARRADAGSAVLIAKRIDEAFAPGTDVSRESFGIRDDYTSLMWLAGTMAMQSGRPADAGPLFWRYGAAARTPQTRTKGFYWAGRAMANGGNRAEANRYFEMAAAFPDQFYGMLALERLSRPLPSFTDQPPTVPTPAERAAFNARPLTQAVREVARGADWPVTVRFMREIADQAESESDHVLVAELARDTGRRDLGVILSQAAHTDGHGNFHFIGFPLIPTPPGSSWTMVHAIARQESQFAMNAVSHAGARGLMQLMPGTAREQAEKLGLLYDASALTTDAAYNLTLGDAYFARMMDYFGGSYPLAVAAYNAGPGNVNKWLRLNGDPRSGGIDWIDWIERITLTETRGYVQRVLENAVVYEAMHPAKATQRNANPLSGFLGKRYPG